MENTCVMCGSPLPKGRLKYCAGNCAEQAQRDGWRRHHDRKMAKGECAYCENQPEDGKATCRACLQKYRGNMKQNIAAWRRDKLCVRCGRPRKPGYKQCYLCLNYAAEWRRMNRCRG